MKRAEMRGDEEENQSPLNKTKQCEKQRIYFRDNLF